MLIGSMAFCASSQGFEFESNLGFTIGNFKDDLGWEVNGKGGYLWEVAPGFSLGPLVGVSYFFSNKGGILFGDSLGATISAAGRYDLSEKMFFGIDLGYGSVSAGNGTSGFYYRPVIGFMVGTHISIIASYASINLNEGDNGTFIRVDKGNALSTIQIGFGIKK